METKATWLFLIFMLLSISKINAQFTYGTTGLLNMPTADMQRDKTAIFGGGFLEKHTTPSRWFYNTFNYYINISFFPWVEIAYTCTLHKALENDPYLTDGYWAPSTYGKFVNQDRNFSIRLRVWKEGWSKAWTPQIVIGGNDVVGDSWNGGSISAATNKSNGFYSRYYIAATKHLNLYGGELGIHFAYVYNKREDYPLNGPCLGVNYRPVFYNPLNIMAEYDSKSVNIGAAYSVWKDHINLIAELNRCKYPSIGAFFKVHLK
ncbi:YjbH domain-containing protein [Bacteroidaceae bacterium HV4-6-C5C]|jgi:Bacterial putative lipoprotein (DUF940).|nr:YjbH domain-containing protein [Bacteroidaceae bacterium HV4-6-C5C]